MKRMESRIAVTFAIMFVVGVIINGLYSVISMEESFFSWEVMAKAMIAALFYLSYVWVNTRRHRILASVGWIGIALLFMFSTFSSFEGGSVMFSSWSWADTVMIAYYCIAYVLAFHQAKELLVEDELNDVIIY